MVLEAGFLQHVTGPYFASLSPTPLSLSLGRCTSSPTPNPTCVVYRVIVARSRLGDSEEDLQEAQDALEEMVEEEEEEVELEEVEDLLEFYLQRASGLQVGGVGRGGTSCVPSKTNRPIPDAGQRARAGSRNFSPRHV